MDVEVKALLSDKVWPTVAASLPPEKKAKVREVWFFDTDTLRLRDHGVILRARVNKKGEVETTTKWRGLPLAALEPTETWARAQDLDQTSFKAELDVSMHGGGVEQVPAFSLTVEEVDPDRLRAALEDHHVRKLFDKAQEHLAERPFPTLPWDELRAFGPIVAQKWEIAADLNLERWEVAGEGVIEVSKKGEDANRLIAEIQTWLHTIGVEDSMLGGGKTAWALGRLVRPPTE